MQRLINRLVPFFMLGIAIVALTFGIFILAYLFMFGALVGLLLFIINWIRTKLSPPNTPAKPKNKKGRIIDSNDWRVL